MCLLVISFVPFRSAGLSSTYFYFLYGLFPLSHSFSSLLFPCILFQRMHLFWVSGFVCKLSCSVIVTRAPPTLVSQSGGETQERRLLVVFSGCRPPGGAAARLPFQFSTFPASPVAGLPLPFFSTPIFLSLLYGNCVWCLLFNFPRLYVVCSLQMWKVDGGLGGWLGRWMGAAVCSKWCWCLCFFGQ